MHGSNFDIVQRPQLVINNAKSVVKRSEDTCDYSDATFIEAVNRTNDKLIFTLPANKSETYSYSFKMDGVSGNLWTVIGFLKR